jgi:hypothetical protein
LKLNITFILKKGTKNPKKKRSDYFIQNLKIKTGKISQSDEIKRKVNTVAVVRIGLLNFKLMYRGFQTDRRVYAQSL